MKVIQNKGKRFASLGVIIGGISLIILLWTLGNSWINEVAGDASVSEAGRTVRKVVNCGDVRGKCVRKVAVELKEPSKIVAIRRSCGCTSIGLEVGQVVSCEQPVQLTVDLTGKPVGDGRQSVMVELDSGTRLELTVRYNHQPLPFCTPEYVILRGLRTPAVVEFYFPAESDIEMIEFDAPAGLDVLNVAAPESSCSVPGVSPVRVSIVAQGLPAAPRGSISIMFSSTEHAVFKIPYLYMAN